MLTLTIPALSFAAPAPVEEIGQPLGRSNLDTAPSDFPAATINGSNTVASNSTPDNSSASSDPYYRMQLLMEELRQLRGLLEEQGNELAMLKKRQREDYLDLDGRLSIMTSGGVLPRPSTESADTKSGTPRPEIGASFAPPNQSDGSVNSDSAGVDTGTTSPRELDEAAQKAAYDRAYSLLKARKIEEAKAGLKQFLQDYPQGAYSANAHYWLGELYLLGGELPDAETEFRAVVDQYPGHRKVNDATFKLGKVYHLQNDLERSRELLERVAAGSDSAARLAQDYLLRNF